MEKKKWEAPVLEVLDINMTMKGFDYKDKPGSGKSSGSGSGGKSGSGSIGFGS